MTPETERRATHYVVAAESYLDRSEEYCGSAAYPAQAQAAATLLVALQLGRIADALETACESGVTTWDGNAV